MSGFFLIFPSVDKSGISGGLFFHIRDLKQLRGYLMDQAAVLTVFCNSLIRSLSALNLHRL